MLSHHILSDKLIYRIGTDLLDNYVNFFLMHMSLYYVTRHYNLARRLAT